MRASIPNDKLVRLEAPKRYYIPNADTQQISDDLIRLAAQICRTPIALITLVDGDCQWFRSNVGLTISETYRDLAFYAHTILQSKPLIVEDTLVDQRFATNPLVTAEPNIRFYAGVPLLMLDGYQLGSLCVMDCVPRQLQIEQIEALQALGRQLVHLLELQRNLMESQQAKEEIDRFFNLPLDMICIVTLDGYFTKLNPAWQTTLGYSIEELKHTPFIDFVHPEDRAKTLAAFEQLVKGGTTPGFENRYRCRDGSYKWFSWAAVPVIASGVLYAIARDITEHKQREITSFQLATIVESSEDAIISK